MNQLVSKQERLNLLLSVLGKFIDAYPSRAANVKDSLGEDGFLQLEALIKLGSNPNVDQNIKPTIELNHQFVVFLKSDSAREQSLRKALGRRGSAYLSNLIDLSL